MLGQVCPAAIMDRERYPPHMQMIIIAAMSENRVIGRHGELPWRLPADLKRFKQMTIGHTVIMGRRTYDTLPKPLPDRANIVITRNPDWSPPNDPGAVVRVVHDLDAALQTAASIDTQSVFTIGGGEIYTLAMPHADRLELTLVHTVIDDGDAWFPQWDHSQWKRIASDHHKADDRHDFAFTFETWQRDPTAAD